MRVVFVIPSFNIAKNIDTLLNSIKCQKNNSWEAIVIDDISSDDSYRILCEKVADDNRFKIVRNKEKKFALRNIIDASSKFQDLDDVIIAVIDGDDSLCNEDTVDILIDSYKKGNEVVWTAHRWDTNNLNISGPIPQNVNPYFWPWKSSHLRTFKSSLLKEIDKKNFKDIKGKWFKRGYDQALMLPLIHVSRKFEYVPEVCYLYNIDSSSIPADERNWCEREQISTINLVRARGFVK